MKKVKSLINRENAKAYVEFLKASGYPYQLKISNYTTEIVSELYNIQFLQSMRGKTCFAAYAKLKADVKNKPVPQVNKGGLRYFNHNFKEDFHAEKVINIDLKSAYATALYNSKFISEPTYNYLGRIPKLDRLASVGMLASKKYVFDYDSAGDLKSFHKQTNELENFFFYCVKCVEEVMNELQMIAEHNYLFTWVDGIYIKYDLDSLMNILEALDRLNYRYTVETLEDFKLKIANEKVKLSFNKEGKPKFFNIPAKPSLFANEIVSLLTNQKINNNDLYYQVKRRAAK